MDLIKVDIETLTGNGLPDAIAELRSSAFENCFMKAKKVRLRKPSQPGAKQTARDVDHLSSQGRALLALIVD